MKQFYQCRLERGSSQVTAWIEQRGARVGAGVDLLPSREAWKAAEVFEPPMAETTLRADQQQKRGGLPSLKRSKA